MNFLFYLKLKTNLVILRKCNSHLQYYKIDKNFSIKLQEINLRVCEEYKTRRPKRAKTYELRTMKMCPQSGQIVFLSHGKNKHWEIYLTVLDFWTGNFFSKIYILFMKKLRTSSKKGKNEERNSFKFYSIVFGKFIEMQILLLKSASGFKRI